MVSLSFTEKHSIYTGAQEAAQETPLNSRFADKQQWIPAATRQPTPAESVPCTHLKRLLMGI